MSSNQLNAAHRELGSAQRSILRMENATSIEEFEDEWRIFLGAIEKCWVKTERLCQPFKDKFQPWQGKYINLRKSDPLLKYLYHARHSDQHSVQEMIEPKPAQHVATIGGLGQSVYIEYLSTDAMGNIASYSGSHPVVHKFLPERIELLPVLSSKKWYQPPRKHLEVQLAWPSPIDVSKLGVEFYAGFLKSVEQKFFSS